MVRSLVALSLLLTAPLCACGGASAESPRAVADTLIKAINTQDPALAVSTLPPVAALEAHFDCGADNSLVKARDRRAERAAKEFSGERMKGVTMSVAAFDLEGTETKTLAEGETWKDCTVKKAVELHRSKLTLHIEKGGEAEDDGETWTFLKLDGTWYYAKL